MDYLLFQHYHKSLSNSEFCRLPQAAALLSKVRHPMRHGGRQCLHQGGVWGEGEVREAAVGDLYILQPHITDTVVTTLPR